MDSKKNTCGRCGCAPATMTWPIDRQEPNVCEQCRLALGWAQSMRAIFEDDP